MAQNEVEDIQVDEKKIKHLDMIQRIITRMAQNSFMIKGWSVSLGVVIFALVGKNINLWYIVLLITPTIMFGFLDAYYLMLEKRFRELYEKVAGTEEESINFSMDLSLCKKKTFGKSLLSVSIWLFYLALIIMELVGVVIINGGFC